MKITETDKTNVLDAFLSHPHAATRPLTFADLRTKTGYTIPKLSAIKALLINDGRIWEFRDSHQKRLLYLAIPEKTGQILDVIKRCAAHERFEYSRLPPILAQATRLPLESVHDILVHFLHEGLLEIEQMKVAPTVKLLTIIAAERTSL